MAEAMNRELRQLAASGCKVIQVEEPTLHFMARYNPEQKELLDFLVDAFNREVEGLDDVEVWIHTCWGNPNMQKVFTRRVLRELDRDLPRTPQGRRLDHRSHRERLQGTAALRAVQELAQEEDRRRRHQPPDAAGRLSRTSSPSASAAASKTSRPTSWCSRPIAASAGRASTATSRSTRRSASRMARNIVLKELGLRAALRPRRGREAGLGPASGPRAVHPSEAAAVSGPKFSVSEFSTLNLTWEEDLAAFAAGGAGGIGIAEVKLPEDDAVALAQLRDSGLKATLCLPAQPCRSSRTRSGRSRPIRTSGSSRSPRRSGGSRRSSRRWSCS